MSNFEMISDPSVEARRAALAADLAAYFSELSGSVQKPEQRFSLSRLLRNMHAESVPGSPEDHVCKAAAVAQGRNWSDHRSAIVPWSVLAQRGLSVSAPSAGGNLVATNLGTPLAVLKPFSIAARMGIDSAYGLTGNLAIPSLGPVPTATWLATETSPIATSDQLTGQIVGTPNTVGVLLKASNQLLKQSNADQVIRDALLTSLGMAIDAAILAGSGANGEPLGLLETDGVTETSGAVSQTTILDGIKALADADVADEAIKFLSTPSLRRILQGRAVAASLEKMIWDGGLDQYPAYVSTACPAATIFGGDWSQVLLAIWGSGVEIVVDPFSGFRSNVVAFRAMVSTDVIVKKPGAFFRHINAS